MPVLVQLCRLIPTHLTASLAKKYGIDKQARTFSAWSHVVTLIFAQLTHASSLNDFCDALCAHRQDREIALFDKAYINFLHLSALHRRGVQWVTRGKDNMAYIVRKKLLAKRAGVLNYFFKQLKQTLQICDFLGHSKEAIRWPLWAAPPALRSDALARPSGRLVTQLLASPHGGATRLWDSMWEKLMQDRIRTRKTQNPNSKKSRKILTPSTAPVTNHAAMG